MPPPADIPNPGIEPESDHGPLHCRRILYQLRYQGSPYIPWTCIIFFIVLIVLWHYLINLLFYYLSLPECESHEDRLVSVLVCPIYTDPLDLEPHLWLGRLCEYLLRSRMNCGPVSISTSGAGHSHSLKCDVPLYHVQCLARMKTSPFEHVQYMENRLEPEGSKLALNVSPHIPRSGYLRRGCSSQGGPLCPVAWTW